MMIRGRAIRWFSDMNGQTFVPDTAAEVMQWIHDLPPQAPKMIRRAVRRRIMQEHTAHRVLRAHRDLKAHCQQKGVVFDDVPGPDVQAASIFPCHECCKSFSTVQGLNANRWKQHQRISREIVCFHKYVLVLWSVFLDGSEAATTHSLYQTPCQGLFLVATETHRSLYDLYTNRSG